MSGHKACATRSRPVHEVADIFRAHGEEYRRQHRLSPEQRAAMRAIIACRTEVLGGHIDVCADCGDSRPSYNSCRNRHCPKCQALSQAQWLDQRESRILPVHYFHVVFTLPAQLKGIGQANPRRFYEILLRAAGETLLTLGRDPKRLAALLGVTAVLHTWTRDLRFHPHVHCIVTGGGLSLQGDRWVDAGPRYLFPVKVLAKLFRGKFLQALSDARDRGELCLPDSLATPEAFTRLRCRLFAKDWVVYAKRPFAGPRQVFAYLGQYTHRVGISNHRILTVSDDSVTIATRMGKTATMPPQEFIRRFLQHILPHGFVKIRHYGLLASSNIPTRFVIARCALDSRAPKRAQPISKDPLTDAPGWREILRRLTGIDPDRCPRCGSRSIYRLPLSELSVIPAPPVRAPPDCNA